MTTTLSVYTGLDHAGRVQGGRVHGMCRKSYTLLGLKHAEHVAAALLPASVHLPETAARIGPTANSDVYADNYTTIVAY